MPNANALQRTGENQIGGDHEPRMKESAALRSAEWSRHVAAFPSPPVPEYYAACPQSGVL